MYIESADLSEKHAEIKYDDATSRFILKDCGSDNGTWVRINRDYDLYNHSRDRIYKIADY